MNYPDWLRKYKTNVTIADTWAINHIIKTLKNNPVIILINGEPYRILNSNGKIIIEKNP